MLGLSVLIFVFGAVVGSFLNVVILRLPHVNQSIVWPKSHCIKCFRTIAFYDLIPIFSWFVLRGKCRYCKAKISWRYPFIELFMGLMALLLWHHFGFSLKTIELFIFIALLITVAFIDIDTWLIPLSLPIILVVSGLLFGIKSNLYSRVLGSIFGFVFFLLVLLIFTWILRKSKRLKPNEFAMGFGDPWLLAGIGAYVGMAYLFYVVFLASIQGILAYLIVKPEAKQTVDGWQPPQSAIAFGPFLSLAGIEVALWGNQMSVISQQLAIFLGN